MIQATNEELTAAFDLWQKRFQENPEKFSAPTGDYGRDCAAYLKELLEELRAGK